MVLCTCFFASFLTNACIPVSVSNHLSVHTARCVGTLVFMKDRAEY